MKLAPPVLQARSVGKRIGGKLTLDLDILGGGQVVERPLLQHGGRAESLDRLHMRRRWLLSNDSLHQHRDGAERGQRAANGSDPSTRGRPSSLLPPEHLP